MGEAKDKKLAQEQRRKILLALMKADRLSVIFVNLIAIITIPLWAWAVLWYLMAKDLWLGKKTDLFEKYFWEQ